MKAITILFAAVLALSACGPIPHSLNPSANYTSLSSTKRQPVDTIPILTLFDGEPLGFSYTKVGLIELVGGQSDKTVLDNFKYQAWKNGGNAVLLIKKERIQSDFSTSTDSLGTTSSSASYTNKWTGLISQVPDSVYQYHVESWNEVDFIRIVEANAVNTRPNTFAVKIMLLAMFGGVLALLGMA